MQTEMWALRRVTPYEHNRRRNQVAIEPVARSIEQFGFRQPIVVDRDGVIVAGNSRWLAAQKLGVTKLPLHVATDLTDEQARQRIGIGMNQQIPLRGVRDSSRRLCHGPQPPPSTEHVVFQCTQTNLFIRTEQACAQQDGKQTPEVI
jgi:hypothetical protein